MSLNKLCLLTNICLSLILEACYLTVKSAALFNTLLVKGLDIFIHYYHYLSAFYNKSILCDDKRIHGIYVVSKTNVY